MDRNAENFFEEYKALERRIELLERSKGGSVESDIAANTAKHNKPFFRGYMDTAIWSYKQWLQQSTDRFHRSADNKTLYVEEAGWYFIDMWQLADAQSEGSSYLNLRKNGTVQKYAYIYAKSSYDPIEVQLSCVLWLDVGDYLTHDITAYELDQAWSNPHSAISIFKFSD